MQKGCNPWRLGHCPQAHVPLSWQQEPFVSAQAIATYPLQLGKQQRLWVPAWCPLPMEVDRVVLHCKNEACLDMSRCCMRVDVLEGFGSSMQKPEESTSEQMGKMKVS